MSSTEKDTAASPVTIQTLRRMKTRGERFVMLTVYDASFTAVLERAGVEVLLVGDSLGMVIQGHATTIPVTLDQMVYHTQNVARARRHALIMADMPFMSFSDPTRALDNAARLMQDGGAHMVKLEGGSHVVPVVEALARHGVPVCGHLGLQPQAVHKLGGYRVQGRDQQLAENMFQEAKSIEAAGADVLLLECVPAALARRITEALSIPTIGIGAGPDCDAQVLVLYDVLGISHGARPRFAQDFLSTLSAAEPVSIEAAVRSYVAAVKEGRFPTADHSFS